MGTHSDLILESCRTALQRSDRAPVTGWGDRHVAAFNRPNYANGESGIVGMIRSLADYADRHAYRFESSIGEDYYLGPIWARMVGCCRDLLNGEIGSLDGGALDRLLLDMLAAEGFDECGGYLKDATPGHPCEGCLPDAKPCETGTICPVCGQSEDESDHMSCT